MRSRRSTPIAVVVDFAIDKDLEIPEQIAERAGRQSMDAGRKRIFGKLDNMLEDDVPARAAGRLQAGQEARLQTPIFFLDLPDLSSGTEGRHHCSVRILKSIYEAWV